MYVLLFVLAIAFFIMFHEFGHFATAKAFGMKVERFFLGFGPTLWSFRRGETEYGVKGIPAGGFVKITGMSHYETYDPEDEGRTFHSKPAWQRVVVLSAGSVSHFVVAAVLLFAALAFFPVPVLADGEPVPDNVIGQVVEGSPADQAGLRAGDEVVSVDGQPVDDFEALQAAVQPRGGQAVTVEFTRDGQRAATTVALEQRDVDGESQGFLGIAPGGLQTRDLGVVEAAQGVVSGPYSLPRMFGMTITGLGQALSPESLSSWFAQTDPDVERTADGPISLVGAGQVVGTLGQLGEFSSILLVFASLNIVLGLLNMLPLPPLDGGHVATVAVEKGVNTLRRLRGREPNWQVDPARITPIALAVILFFGLFTLTALYIDIVNPASELLR